MSVQKRVDRIVRAKDACTCSVCDCCQAHLWFSTNLHVTNVLMIIIIVIAFQNSWTALIVATSGGFTDVVTSLLERHPNVNAVDKVIC